MTQSTIINSSVSWDRIRDWARKAGRVSPRPVLLIFYVVKSRETPWKDRMLALSAISYLIFPIDILDAKRLPIIGWLDEIATISVAYQKVYKHVTPEIEAKMDIILDRLFPEYTWYEIIESE